MSLARTRTLGLASIAMAAVALAGCYSGSGGGNDDDADETGGTDSDPTAGTDPTDPSGDTDQAACEDEGTSVSRLRRLSAQQYRNALSDMLAPAGIDVTALAAMELDRIPVDDPSTLDVDGSFAILDDRVSDLHARAYYRIADRLGDVVAYDDEHLTAVFGACALETDPGTACVDAFLDDFAMRAYRRPLTEEERAVLHTIADESPDSTEMFRSLVFMVLMSPQFLYHTEVDGEGDDAAYNLDGYGLASRLSFHFWQSMPDPELFAAAADGSLLTDDGYRAQLDRVFDDPRTQITVDRFYDEWLAMGWLTVFPDTPAFATFAEGTSIGDPAADHLLAAQDEVHALVRHFTFGNDGTLADLLLTDMSFTQSPHLAALYGVEPWDGVSANPTMPPGERAGLLTRVAFLLTGNHETHPVHRGAVVRQKILCDDLPQPDPTMLPPGSLDKPPVTDDQTTRERYEAKTADGVCAGCHQAINPVGFVLERYDAIGRFRSEEVVIDEDSGEVIATLPIDSAAAPMLGEDAATISTGIELSQQVLDSGRAEACFAKQYFRSTFGRQEAPEDDCTVAQIETTLAEGGSLREALRAIALEPVFRTRRAD